MPEKRDPHGEPPKPGSAGPGKPFVPGAIEEEESAPTRKRPAPPPRTPLSEEDYERLKEAAESAEAPPLDPAQEDPNED